MSDFIDARAGDVAAYDAYCEAGSTPPVECPDCGDTHGSSCPWRDTCAECSRTDVDMAEPRLCVDCADGIERHELAMRKRERALDWGEYLQERGAL